MFRCKVCGWIHDGAAPPDVCVSCGATADRFRPMDAAEVDAATGELASYGIAGQGFDDIDVDDTRRIRLLAFVDASFFSHFMARSGQRYPIYTGDPQWFSGQHPVHDRLPVAHRHLALHRADRRRPLRRLLRAQPRAQRLPGLPRPHVRPPLRGRLPAQGSRRPDRHLLPEAGRRRLPRRNPPRSRRRPGTD